MLAATLVTMVAAFAYTTQQQPQFESTSTVQLLWPRGQQPGATQLPNLDTSTSAATSPIVRERLAENLGIEPTAIPAGLSAEFDLEAFRFFLTARSGDESAARLVADAHAIAYIEALQVAVDNEIAQLDERLEELTEEIDDLQGELADNPDDQLVQTQLNAALQNYSQFSAQIEAARFAGPPAEVAAPATAPRPTGLSAATILIVAALLGLFAGVGIALLRSEFDARIRAARDVRGLTDAPLLAEIPRDRDAAERPWSLPVSDPDPTPFTNGIRALRTAIHVLEPDQGAVILVTSAEPGEGKTFIAANLAASWALSGKDTILVSGDLRQPQVDRYFPAVDDESPGQQRIEVAEAGAYGVRAARTTTAAPEEEIGAPLRPTHIDRLLLYSAIKTVGDPADLLATTLVREMIADLRRAADIVIIDSPPVLAVADPLILGGYADGVVVVTMAKRSKKPALAQAIQHLEVDKIRILGVALNGTKPTADQVYGRYYNQSEPGGGHRKRKK